MSSEAEIYGELPEGWRWEKASELCTAIPNGSTPKADLMASSGEVPFVKVYNLTFDGSLDFSKEPTFISRDTHEMQLRRSRSKPGAVLMNIVGPPLGKVSILPDSYPEWNFNQAIVAFHVQPERLNNRFLAYYLRHASAAWAAKFSKATVGQHNIAVSDCRDMDVPVPPLPEQRRIVKKLETLQARSRRARGALDAVPALLEKLRQSILAAAFRGDLTADWRAQHPDVEPASELLKRIRIERRKKWEEAELTKLKAKGKIPPDNKWKQKYVEPAPVDDSELPELPEGWCWARLGDLGADPLSAVQTGPFGAMLHNDDFVDDGVPVIAVGNLTGMGFRSEGLYYVTPAKADELSRFDVHAGDVLFARSGATLGKVCVAPPYVSDWRMTGHILRLRLNRLWLRSELAVYALAGEPAVQQQVADSIRGVTRPGYNTGLLEAIVVPLPPRTEQDAIVERIEKKLAVGDSYGRRRGDVMAALSSLDSAILAKAFRGELVPQDPSELVTSPSPAVSPKSVTAPAKPQKLREGRSK
jgi:type I restriction enzyme S subunit